MGKIQLIFLGKQKQPSWGRTEEDKIAEVIKWYKVVPQGGYRVGDGIAATITEQYAFGCPRNLEIYKIREFEEENGFTCDSNLIPLEEYIDEYCSELMEIYSD